MPARGQLPGSPSPADGDDDEAAQVLFRGKQTALSRRKTTANDEAIDPSLLPPSQPSKVGPRKTMPSHSKNDLISTPRSSQSLAQIRTSSHDHTPKRTPVMLGPTVDKRFEALLENSNAILSFYQDYAERMTDPELELLGDMDQQISRYWSMFTSTRKHQVLPSKDNDEEFLDSIAILQGNNINFHTDQAKEIIEVVTAANRATFVHLIAQLPFQLPSSPTSPDFSPWTMDQLNEYLSQDQTERWPLRNIEELQLARRQFFQKVVPRRRKHLVTLDDLHLFLELCTQIAIDDLWKFSTIKNAKERRQNVISQLEYLFSTSPIVDALEEGKQADLIEATYGNMAADRMKRFQELKYAPAYVQKEFPFQVASVVLINYIAGLRHQHPFPLQVVEDGLAVPQNEEHIYSPGLRTSYNKTVGMSGEMQVGGIDEDAEGEVDEEQRSDSRHALRFNKDSRLERVDTDDTTSSIVNRRGYREVIRDTEFDEGDPDVFRMGRMKSTATRGKGKKRVLQARKGKAAATASEPSIRKGDFDEEMPDAATLLAQKGNHIQTSQPSAEGQGEADFEVDQVELQTAQKESVDRRGEIQKRKRIEREESEYLPSTAGPSAVQSSFQGNSEASSPKAKKPKQERLGYRYATGGNQVGRRAWSEDETSCLLKDLQDLNHRHLEAQGKNVRFTVWKTILMRHGSDGTESTILKNRNNVQLKDKARNEVEKLRRAEQPIPLWLAHYG